MKQRKSTEDYLKTIYILESQQGVHGSDVARMLKVTRPTVSIALKALEQEGYVWMDESRLVHLTGSGLQIAKDTYERHQFFQGFLTGLGINPEIAAHDACEMEHSVSPETFSAMKAMLERVKGTTTKE